MYSGKLVATVKPAPSWPRLTRGSSVAALLIASDPADASGVTEKDISASTAFARFWTFAPSTSNACARAREAQARTNANARAATDRRNYERSKVTGSFEGP